MVRFNEMGLSMSSITVVVPVFNEEKYINKVLTSLVNEKNKHGTIHKIIVVDNESTDNTQDEINKFNDVELIVANGTISKIRNIGSLNCKSDIIAFIDGDCVIQNGWSAAVIDCFDKHAKSWPNIIIGSAVKVPEKCSWIEGLWFSRISEKSNGENHINAGNMIMPSSLFNELEGFDDALKTCEDIDICQRAKDNGAILCEEKSIQVIHLGFPKNILEFIKREYWHGRGMLGSNGSIANNKALFLSVYTLVYIIIGLLVLLLLDNVLYFLLISITYLISLYIISNKVNYQDSFLNKVKSTFLLLIYAGSRTSALLSSLVK